MKRLLSLMLAVYVVRWTTLAMAECPDYKPDEFGRWPTTHCLVLHAKSVPQSKEFTDKREAREFFKRAQAQEPKKMNVIGGEPARILNLGDIFDVKFEEIR